MSNKLPNAKALTFPKGKGNLATVKKKCQACGEAFEAERSTARFCGNACRQRAHYRRENPEPGKPGRPRTRPEAIATTQKRRGRPPLPPPDAARLRAAMDAVNAARQ